MLAIPPICIRRPFHVRPLATQSDYTAQRALLCNCRVRLIKPSSGLLTGQRSVVTDFCGTIAQTCKQVCPAADGCSLNQGRRTDGGAVRASSMSAFSHV
eukprot:3325161-Pyramimonas_sp.AAC.1